MDQYQAQFTSFGSGAQPTLGSAPQADLGIPALEAEYDRQTRAAEKVQDQVRRNQDQLIENAKTQSLNAKTDINNLKDIAAFSKTATEALVGYQKKINEQKEMTGLMEAFMNGIPVEEQEAFDVGEAEAAASEIESSRVAGNYLRQGGLPQVASALRGMNNHKALGYAKGLLMQAGADYPTYLAMKRKTFAMNIGGKEVTLATANAPERAVLMRALNEMYISQFQGLNPALLNKYLFDPMRKGMAADQIQWTEDWQKNQEIQATSDRRADLAKSINGATPVQSAVFQLDNLQAYYGSGAVARTKLIEDIQYLRKAGIITPQRESEIYNSEFTDKSGKTRRMVDWVEFAAANSEADEAADELRRDVIDKENLRKKEAQLTWQQMLPDIREEDLQGPQRLQFAKEFANRNKLDLQSTQYLLNWINQDSDKANELKEALYSRIDRGMSIGEQDLNGYNSLRNDTKIAAALKESGQLQAGDFKGADAELTAAVVAISKSGTAEGLTGNLEATQLLNNAKEQVRKEYQLNLANYKDPEKAMQKALDNVLNRITPYSGEADKYGNVKSMAMSPLSNQNYLKLDPKEQEFVNIGQAQREISQRATNKVDPFATVLTGSEPYLEEMDKNIKAGKRDPIPAFYEVLARGQPFSKWHIANAQRIANGQSPIPLPPEVERLRELPPSAVTLLERTPDRTQGTMRRVQYQTEMAGDKGTGDAYQNLLGLIRSGEGSYNSANRGVAADSPGGIPGLENKTLGQWKALQNSGWFALGAYQFIPETLRMAARGAGITDGTVMTKAVQDRLAIELIMGGQKRPRLTAYLSGRSDNLDGALDAIALEWASIQNARGVSAYAGVGGNAAHIGRDEARRALVRLREQVVKSPYNQNENLKPGLRK